jgi:hypothetical protein
MLKVAVSVPAPLCVSALLGNGMLNPNAAARAGQCLTALPVHR